jgi:hypothetical protein
MCPYEFDLSGLVLRPEHLGDELVAIPNTQRRTHEADHRQFVVALEGFQESLRHDQGATIRR